MRSQQSVSPASSQGRHERRLRLKLLALELREPWFDALPAGHEDLPAQLRARLAMSDVAGWRVPELGEVLAMNGQTKTGNKAFVQRKVIDGAARGAPAICDLCGKGKPKPVEDE